MWWPRAGSNRRTFDSGGESQASLSATQNPPANTWSPAQFCVTNAPNAAISGLPEWGWHFSGREVQVRSWSSEEAKWAMPWFRAVESALEPKRQNSQVL